MNYTEKIKKIDALQQKIDAYGALSIDIKKKINYKFRLDWNYYSNSMEGNTLTIDETRSVMAHNLTVGGKPIKDVLEMRGHDEVIDEILRIGKSEIRISEAQIRAIHHGIMHEDDPAQKKKIGTWKAEPNYINNQKGDRFDFALPILVSTLIRELIHKTNAYIDAIEQQKPDAPHALEVALAFHLEYVTIHPFYDGNGRTARIFTNLLLISLGYPPFWIKTNERNAYHQYIGDVQSGGTPDLFFGFCADMVLRSQNLILDAIDGKDIYETDDIDKEIALLKATLQTENTLNARATHDIICDAVEQNIIPIFVLIEEKCAKLKEFFFEQTRSAAFITDNEQININFENKNWAEIKENLLQEIKTDAKKIIKIHYNYALKGFKKVIAAPSVWVNIEIYFDDYNYTIKNGMNNEQKMQLAYNKKLTAEAIKDFVSPIIRETIEAIKHLNGNA